MHPCIPPGTPPPAHVLPVLYILLLMVYWCQTMRPWAQPGNNPWVERGESPSSLKGVRIERELCAEL